MPYYQTWLETGEPFQIYYLEAGKGDTLFLLHGWFQNARECFHEYLPGLSKQFRVIAVDLPGHGKSIPPGKISTPEYSPEMVASVLAQMIRDFKTRGPVHLAGASLGAYIALEICLDYPDIIDHLILISPFLDFHTGQNPARKILGLAPVPLYFSLLQKARAKVFPFNSAHLPEWQINGKPPGWFRHFLQKIKNHPVRASQNYIRNFIKASLMERFPKNSHATLIIYGEHDYLTPPDYTASMARKMPRAALRIIPAAGHQVYLTHAKEIITLMENFIRENTQRKKSWLRLFWKKNN